MTFTPVNLTLTVGKTPFQLNLNTSETPFILTEKSPSSITLTTGTSLTGPVSLVGPSSIKGITFFAAGQFQPDEYLMVSIAPYAFTISLQNSSVHALEAPTADVSFSIYKTVAAVTTLIGTIDFQAGETEATLTLINPDINGKDLITIQAPSVSDATLADIVFLLAE